jgi:hypothetical protein
MGMKVCGGCKIEKPLDDFYQLYKDSEHYQNNCKQCAREVSARWRKENKDKVRKSASDNYRKKRGYPDDYVSNYGRRGSTMPGSSAIERNSNLLVFYDNLSDRHKAEIRNIYAKRAEMNKAAGYIKYHVDHIAPIQGMTISGLHAPWNIRIVEKSENHKKWATYDAPDSWSREDSEEFLYEVFCRFVDEGMHPNDVTKATWRWPKGREKL